MQARYKIVGALWFFQVANYTDRLAIAFLGPLIISSLGMDHESFGIILSSFGIGYTLAQIPGGIVADRWSVRALMIIAPLLWALCTGLTALMTTVVGFMIVRICLGLSEGMSNAAIFKVLGENFTPKERTGAVAVSSTAHAVGPALAAPLIGIVAAMYSWQVAFLVLIIPPLLAAVLNYRTIPSHRHAGATVPFAPAEPGWDEEISFMSIMRLPSLWLFVFVYFCFNIAFWGYNGWMPTYLSTAHHIDMKQLGMLGSIPYFFSFAGLLALGAAAMSLHRWRPQLVAMCWVLTGVSLYVAFASEALWGTMAGLCSAAFFLNGSIPSFSSLMLELSPPSGRARYSGIVFTAGQIGGVVAPFVIGRLVQTTKSFASGFAFMEIALLAAAAVIVFLPIFMASNKLVPQPA